ncbi:hypothetical protein [Mesorhizobium sp. M0522]|uniref:hypothetical protein n=1 Tax=Mesorhizobium sp. M0522 TaxID=2956958 RepID=UPI00333B1E1A
MRSRMTVQWQVSSARRAGCLQMGSYGGLSVRQVEFLRNQGFRVTIDHKSIVIVELATGSRLTVKQQRSHAEASLRYLWSIQGIDGLSFKGSDILRASAVLSDSADEAFKYVPDDAIEYLRSGSILVSSLERYRRIENPEARDPYEGLGFVAFNDKTSSTTLGLEGGYSNYVLCLGSRAPKSERRLMGSRFGPNLVKISGLGEFSRKLSDLLGAEDFRIADVHYSDHKMLCLEHTAASEIRAVLKENSYGTLNDEVLLKVAEQFFPLLRETADAVTTFCKPRRFGLEHERRVCFAMPRDVTEPIAIVKSKDLLSHLSFEV